MRNVKNVLLVFLRNKISDCTMNKLMKERSFSNATFVRPGEKRPARRKQLKRGKKVILMIKNLRK
jgi:hypothetical protein